MYSNPNVHFKTNISSRPGVDFYVDFDLYSLGLL